MTKNLRKQSIIIDICNFYTFLKKFGKTVVNGNDKKCERKKKKRR